MQSVLSIDNISKRYGRIQALKNVSFEVPEGCVFGILGPNGSGKTTMLGTLLNVLKSDSGSFSWFGQANKDSNRKRIGSLLETPNFYHYLSAVDNLKVTQAISGRGKRSDIDEALETVKLTERKKSKFKTYSLGMKQRLAIGAALLGNPEVLVLDEPTNGLDPVGILEMRELIKHLAKQGKTIIIASHLLDEVEKVCTHVAILKKGELLTAGAVDEVLVNEDIVEISASDISKLQQVVANIPGCLSAVLTDKLLHLKFALGTSNLEAINQYCFNNGVVLNQLTARKKSLETKFFELTNN